jgi:cytochrome c oxidase subunit 3
MTGFHGLHVLGGLILMGAVAAAVAGRSRAPVRSTVEVCGYYWHFVDVVWVAMFTTIYVLG